MIYRHSFPQFKVANVEILVVLSACHCQLWLVVGLEVVDEDGVPDPPGSLAADHVQQDVAGIVTRRTHQGMDVLFIRDKLFGVPGSESKRKPVNWWARLGGVSLPVDEEIG